MQSGTSKGAAAVDRALGILAAYQTGDGWLTLAELARRTGLYKSTLLRLINSLIAARLLARSGEGTYGIGPEALRLGGLYQQSFDVADIILPILRELSEAFGETCSFYVREGTQRVCLHRVEPNRSLRMQLQAGDSLPLDRGAGGRVLSAFAGAEGELADRVRAEGGYYSAGELDAETAGIAAPVFGPGRRLLGAVVVTAPISRLDATAAREWMPALKAAAAKATSALGG